MTTGVAPQVSLAPDVGSPESDYLFKPGDIFFTRGDGLLARAIRFFTRRIGERRTEVNHVGLIVDENMLPRTHCIEALLTVKRHRLWSHYLPRRTTGVAIYRPRDLSPAEAMVIAAEAEHYVGRHYGWPMLIAHFLDWLLQGAYVFRRLVGSDDYPICSWVVAYSYAAAGRGFGTDPGAADPDDIWDYVTDNPNKFREVRDLKPFAGR